MAAKTDTEVARAALLKAIRTAVRLRHSLEADAELNSVLDEAAKSFDQKVLRGELPETAFSIVFEEHV